MFSRVSSGCCEGAQRVKFRSSIERRVFDPGGAALAALQSASTPLSGIALSAEASNRAAQFVGVLFATISGISPDAVCIGHLSNDRPHLLEDDR